MQLTFIKIWDAIIARFPARPPTASLDRPAPSRVAPVSASAPELAPPQAVGVRVQTKAARSKPPATTRAEAPADSMAARYEAMTRELLEAHGVRVRKWRTGMCGVAWCVHYRDGRIVRLIEAPRPVGPMSAAVFCHEIGHHAIGFNVYKPRCLEEYHAWAWALREMEARGLNVTDKVRARMRKSLEYAVSKSLRRGIKSLPAEMEPYIEGARRFLR